MSKKIFLTILIIFSIVSICTLCLANTGENPIQDATNSVRNVVGGAENALENGAKGATNMVKEGTNAVENTAQNATNKVENTTSSISSNMMSNTNSYVASRTSTDANGSATLMGMNSTTWIWLILGIATIAIVALVWYYSMQMTTNKNNRRLD